MRVSMWPLKLNFCTGRTYRVLVVPQWLGWQHTIQVNGKRAGPSQSQRCLVTVCPSSCPRCTQPSPATHWCGRMTTGTWQRKQNGFWCPVSTHVWHPSFGVPAPTDRVMWWALCSAPTALGPLHMVTKKDGWHSCKDFRHLNDITTLDRSPLQHIQDFSVHLAKAIFFLKVDLVQCRQPGASAFTGCAQNFCYHPVWPVWVPVDAFLTWRGSHRYSSAWWTQCWRTCCSCLSWSLCSPRRSIDYICIKCFCTYTNKGWLWTRPSASLDNLWLMFWATMFLQKGRFLRKVEAVTAFPQPSKFEGLQEFLGMVNLYHRFIQQLNQCVPCMRLSGAEWPAVKMQAFANGKATLANATLLTHPWKTSSLALTADNLDYMVGAVCEQWVDGAWQPLAFFSRNLTDSERKYSTFDRELLALYLATHHFCFPLEGCKFNTCVDHKPQATSTDLVSQVGQLERHSADTVVVRCRFGLCSLLLLLWEVNLIYPVGRVSFLTTSTVFIVLIKYY